MDISFEELYKHNYMDEDEFYDIAEFDDFEEPKNFLFDEESFKEAPDDSFDWRDHGVNTSIKNQGLCGACYAYASLEAIESQIFLKTGKSLEFSRQEIVSCSKNHGTNGCNGGIVIGVFSFINQMGGLTLQKDFEDKAQCDENEHRYKFTISEIGELKDDEELLKKVLYNEGPLVVAIDSLNESFFRYSSGIYFEENCTKSNRLPAHIMLLVGYGRTKDGTEFWIAKNSYGKLWGESGYMRIARNKNNHCKIASYGMIPIIDESHFTQEHQSN
jgi:C1A family cysteine protease